MSTIYLALHHQRCWRHPSSATFTLPPSYRTEAREVEVGGAYSWVPFLIREICEAFLLCWLLLLSGLIRRLLVWISILHTRSWRSIISTFFAVTNHKKESIYATYIFLSKLLCTRNDWCILWCCTQRGIDLYIQTSFTSTIGKNSKVTWGGSNGFDFFLF